MCSFGVFLRCNIINMSPLCFCHVNNTSDSFIMLIINLRWDSSFDCFDPMCCCSLTERRSKSEYTSRGRDFHSYFGSCGTLLVNTRYPVRYLSFMFCCQTWSSLWPAFRNTHTLTHTHTHTQIEEDSMHHFMDNFVSVPKLGNFAF
jgi:hypothetical protein